MLIDPGLYCRVAARNDFPTPAVFLDRDGVIVEETNYLHRVEEIRMIPQAAPAIRRLNELGIPVVLITNQAGVGRGYYDWPEFETVQAEIERRIAPAHLDAVLACGYHPDGKGALGHDHHFRKPHPGMLRYAARAMNLDLARSWMIGDKLLDLEAGIHAGLAGAILVRTGYGREMEAGLDALRASETRMEVADTISEAVEIVTAAMAPL